ncbi:uncharacterized protein LOC116257172 [Nymphaea colorata]|nr:uncharacterized protein LOC116257172 [Nymphaea colorata]
MTFLCFVLDLRSLPLPLLKDFRQSLLQLANLYAISSPSRGSRSQTPGDLIALCYIQRNRSSDIDELEIAYSPRGQFNLRDFHHAVSSLPEDCFLSDLDASKIPEAEGPILSKLLHGDYLYSWGGKDIARKVFVISSLLLESMEYSREMLADAASKKVRLEFILIERGDTTTNLFSQASEKVKDFLDCMSNMKNCVFHRYSWDDWLFSGFVKSWLQELKGDIEEPLKATFYFKNTIMDSGNHFSCNLFASAVHMVDGFVPCQTCRCHGLPAGSAAGRTSMSCPVANQELALSELSEIGIKVGERTILHLPSFQSYSEPQRVHGHIRFNVIERTSLCSLSEGVILGTSYFAVPCNDAELSSAECGKQNLNTQPVFHGICGALHSLDQGLVCTSTCNTDTMRESIFTFFYLLQPSDKGPMLLRKLAGSEEILTIPERDGLSPSSEVTQIESSIQANLLKIGLRDYNPLQHELGFHMKLNALVKESLQIGAIVPRRSKPISKPDFRRAVEQSPIPTMLESQFDEDGHMLTQLTDEGRKACDDEWEQLVVNELNGSLSPALRSVGELEVRSPDESLAEKTSSILERLEPPRSQTPSPSSPNVAVDNLKKQMTGPPCASMKKPLVPFEQSDHERLYSLSQPLKPNFQRFKRNRIFNFS